MIMAALEDGAVGGVIGRDEDAVLVSEDARLDLPISESRAKGERDVLMHGLEGLEDEGITRGRGCNAVGEGGVNEVDKEGQWEEGDIGIVRVIRGEEVGAAGEGVGTSKKLSGDVDHFEVKISKVDKPTRLATVKRLGLTEIGQVLVVGKDLYGKGGTMEIVAPRFQGANDGKEFAVIDIIVSFGGEKDCDR